MGNFSPAVVTILRFGCGQYNFELGALLHLGETMKKILILAANPNETTRLRLDKEVRDIQEGLNRAQRRDDFKLIPKLAVRPRDIQRALLDEAPQIVHFSGHGDGEEGLVFEDDTGNIKLVSGEALANLFGLFSSEINCVLLNGCYSKVQAESINEYIDYVIGMSQAISDNAAIEFSVSFYDALGAGRPYEFAYKLACAAIQLNASVPAGSDHSRKLVPLGVKKTLLGEHLIPTLFKRQGLEQTDGAISSSDINPRIDTQAKKEALESNLVSVEQAGQARLEILDRQISEEEKKLQNTLSTNLQELLEWLKNNQRELSQAAWGYILEKKPSLVEGFSKEEQEDFQWDIEKYVESVYFSMLSNSFDLLDEPAIGPSINSLDSYQTAFALVKRKAPGRVGKDAISLLSERFDYLLERLFITL
jgi:hypothetical protein